MSEGDAQREPVGKIAKDLAVTFLLIVGPLVGFAVLLVVVFVGGLLISCEHGACL